ncbi:MAG: type I methionyl aminopeptidase [Candidatus Aminicenantes bacterium]|nr:type I methionyl aminopeptidase [Candidatus Aminicenantes bacterium]
MIILKTDRELKLMREANRIIAVILNDIESIIKPGATTYELDQWAETHILDMKAKPAFKGYRGFPATLCTSVNNEVVHGIPLKNRKLQDGDIIGIDVGCIYKDFYGDGAWTYPVGDISSDASDLIGTCRDSLYKGIEQAREGNRVSDISNAIDKCVRSKDYEIIRDLTGHGIGRSLHEEPQILNFNCGIKGPKLKANMTLSIEPMITNGSYEVKTLDDNWTVVTVDGSLSAHYEHTVAITENGPEIMTRL